MDGQRDAWMDAWLAGCMDRWVDGWMNGWTDGRMLEASTFLSGYALFNLKFASCLAEPSRTSPTSASLFLRTPKLGFPGGFPGQCKPSSPPVPGGCVALQYWSLQGGCADMLGGLLLCYQLLHLVTR